MLPNRIVRGAAFRDLPGPVAGRVRRAEPCEDARLGRYQCAPTHTAAPSQSPVLQRYGAFTGGSALALREAIPAPPLTSLLIVDDEPSVRELMSRWVESMGFESRTAGSAEEALESAEETEFEIAIVDVVMPGKNGLWLVDELRRDHPQTAVVLATGHVDQLEGSSQSVADLLIKPFHRERFALAVNRGREWHRHSVEELDRHARLSAEVRASVAAVIGELREARALKRDEVAALSRMAFERTRDVAAHAERVARFCISIARELKVSAEALADIETAARFHDIGKMVIPGSVLTKAAPLGPSEASIMRQHVDAGAEILDGTSALAHLAPIVRASHEWFGGGGYPRQLAGSEIPLASRMITVADAYDAMTQDRAYRGPVGAPEAATELLRCSPAQFDPEVVMAFLAVLGRH